MCQEKRFLDVVSCFSRCLLVSLGFIMSLLHSNAFGHAGDALSVPDAVAQALELLQEQVPSHKRDALTPEQALPLLTAAQRHALATQYVRFEVNQPVLVRVARDVRWASEPFWLRTLDFYQTGETFQAAGTTFDVWEKEFPAGPIGLGVNSLTGSGIHYVLAVKAVDKLSKHPLIISKLYPKQLRLHQKGDPLQPFVDNRYILDVIPKPLEGYQMIRLMYGRRDQGKLLKVLRTTKFPSKTVPDQWVLTWSDDPKTTQTIQWRAADSVGNIMMCVHEVNDILGCDSGDAFVKIVEPSVLASPTTVNDPKNHRYAITVKTLKPGTTYQYAWRYSPSEVWRMMGKFTTAPSRDEDFSFLYLGDAQNGLATWGKLITKADQHQPDARFVLMAGDLVDRGNDRDDWDAFFAAANGIFSRKTLVPVIGNHETQGGHPALYLSLFRLLENGPKTIAPERAYAFEYGNAQFIILDTNVPLSSQTKWLENRLAQSKAHWKFVSYHHPAYPSSDRSVDPDFQAQWLPLFDRFKVDFALQGHDHAYLRSYPMKGGQAIKEKSDVKQGGYLGTRYLISVSGTKMYPQKPSPYIEKGFVKVATYQIFELKVAQEKLIYRAYDDNGTLRDEVVVFKPL